MTISRQYDAVVVGSGPNGLAAAITMARRGLSVLVLEAKDSIGGGIRTQELTRPGFRHDVCATIHALALVSPFFRSLDLSAHGLEWVHPPVPLAHPLDDGEAVLLERSVEATAQGLGPDSDNYRGLFGPALRNWEKLVPDLLKPLGRPRHPLTLLQFGKIGIRSALGLAKSRFKGERARALFAGNSAHSILPLERWFTASFGLMLCIIGHAIGWPFAKGGSQAIADALLSYLESLGGEVEVGSPVSSLDDIPKARAVLFDITPRQLARIAGIQFPVGYRKRLVQHKHGPGAFKVDWALKAPIPWKDPTCLQAGTLHLGGTMDEIAEAEFAAWTGVPHERPFVLLAQPSLFDCSRAPKDMHTAWAYCHVPNGCAADMTERIEAQIDRFAPGFRERVLDRSVMSPAALEEYNPNYVGGDIVGGVQAFPELFVRPLGEWQAYSTPAKGIYLCSSSMPPGGGVHGMCGYLAARRALREIF